MWATNSPAMLSLFDSENVSRFSWRTSKDISRIDCLPGET